MPAPLETTETKINANDWVTITLDEHGAAILNANKTAAKKSQRGRSPDTYSPGDSYQCSFFAFVALFGPEMTRVDRAPFENGMMTFYHRKR